MTNELFDVQRELIEIRKILSEIREPREDDDSYEFDEHMDLGFFGTEYDNKNNIFESADKETNMKLPQEENEKTEKELEEKVSVSFELEEDLFLQLAIAAHKKDMTFNDFIVYLIDEHMAEILNNK